MSETVERRLVDLLGHPTESPYGNPIPGLDELGEAGETDEFMDGMVSLAEASGTPGSDQSSVRVRRISEELQKDEELMSTLRRIGAVPDKVVGVTATELGVLVGSGGESAEIDLDAAAHIFVGKQ